MKIIIKYATSGSNHVQYITVMADFITDAKKLLEMNVPGARFIAAYPLVEVGEEVSISTASPELTRELSAPKAEKQKTTTKAPAKPESD